MKVHSLIRRPAGHEVVMEGVRYAFRPPEWACEVNEPRHAARFAAVSEGYRLELEPMPMEATARPVIMAKPSTPTGQRRRYRPGESENRTEATFVTEPETDC